MAKAARSPRTLSRREFAVGSASIVMQLFAVPQTRATQAQTLDQRFDALSKNGNSTCSPTFTDSLSTMPATGRLKGSCCSPMERQRYGEQIEALKKYSAIEAIPPDPYDIAAGTAQKAMSYYDLTLSSDEDKAYRFAMANSDEKGPCCCQCWRWRVYGGLAKLLIREHKFTGEQVVDVWNLSNGCGGSG